MNQSVIGALTDYGAASRHLVYPREWQWLTGEAEGEVCAFDIAPLHVDPAAWRTELGAKMWPPANASTFFLKVGGREG